MKYSNLEIIGHQKQFEILKNCYKRNFPQSWLFFGDKGIGKSLFVHKFISWSIAFDLFKKDISDKDLTNDEINTLNSYFYSTVYEINNEEKISDLESIRKLINKIVLTNFSEKLNKYIILDNVESLNINSKNALLKTIEEPPEKTIILLICHNIYNLPRTIISRCLNLEFNNLIKKDFYKYLDFFSLDFDENEKQKIFNFSNGSPGLFHKIQNNNGMQLVEKFNDIIKEETLNHLILKEISEKLIKESEMVFILLKRFFFLKCVELAKNTKDNNFLYKIIAFLEIIKDNNETNLNIDKNQIITNIFVNYYELIKK